MQWSRNEQLSTYQIYSKTSVTVTQPLLVYEHLQFHDTVNDKWDMD